MDNKTEKKRDYLLPASIIIAAILISGAFVYDVGRNARDQKTPPLEQTVGNPLLSLSKVTSADHIIGNIDAPITVVLFSDTECPYCKDFHNAMHRAANEYGTQIAWVYRHAPIHSKSQKEAEAMECAADQRGNEGFWKYLDRIMEITPSNDGLSETELPAIASYVGLDVNKFNECLSSGKFEEKVKRNLSEALAVGMKGTPYSVIVIHGVPLYSIPGAVPYEELKNILDGLKNEL